MRLIHYLNELWMTTRYNKSKFEVLENPSQKEMREIGEDNTIRFISVNSDKKVWVWKASAAIHAEVWEESSKINKGIDYYKDAQNYAIFGIAEQKGGSHVMVASDVLEYRHDDIKDKEELYKESQWVNKYIKIDKYMKQWLDK
jgi:hypothetical protein